MTHLRGCLRHVCLVTLACAASGVAGCGPSARGGGAAPVETTPVTPAAVASSAGATGTPGAAAVTPPLSPLPFGGERFGFVEASSANGRYVALRRFAGSGEPQFGHHGEVMNGSELVMVDLVDLSERPFDEVIDVAPGRRFFLLITDNVPVLLDSATGTYEPLADADTRPDGNTCLGPRQASFSATGLRVGWVVGQATALRVRDLASGEEWSVAAATPLWRGWPDDEGRGAVLAEVPAGSAVWPEQHTSCACRWCNRFAASYGFYGWGGASFALTHVDAAGARTAADAPEGARRWHADDDAGCRITPADDDRGYEQGPWQRTCS